MTQWLPSARPSQSSPIPPRRTKALEPSCVTTRRIRKKAEVAFRRVIDLKPNDPVAYTNLGNALWHQNKRDEAVGAYRKALALKPDLAEAHYFHYLLGKALYDKGDLDGAIAEYRKAIQLKEDYPEAHTN